MVPRTIHSGVGSFTVAHTKLCIVKCSRCMCKLKRGVTLTLENGGSSKTMFLVCVRFICKYTCLIILLCDCFITVKLSWCNFTGVRSNCRLGYSLFILTTLSTPSSIMKVSIVSFIVINRRLISFSIKHEQIEKQFVLHFNGCVAPEEFTVFVFLSGGYWGHGKLPFMGTYPKVM